MRIIWSPGNLELNKKMSSCKKWRKPFGDLRQETCPLPHCTRIVNKIFLMASSLYNLQQRLKRNMYTFHYVRCTWWAPRSLRCIVGQLKRQNLMCEMETIFNTDQMWRSQQNTKTWSNQIEYSIEFVSPILDQIWTLGCCSEKTKKICVLLFSSHVSNATNWRTHKDRGQEKHDAWE